MEYLPFIVHELLGDDSLREQCEGLSKKTMICFINNTACFQYPKPMIKFFSTKGIDLPKNKILFLKHIVLEDKNFIRSVTVYYDKRIDVLFLSRGTYRVLKDKNSRGASFGRVRHDVIYKYKEFVFRER